jgi:DNA-binding LacI/PurR family transcriptional regulator
MSIVAVAKRAGVSVATVSRVINDLQNVRAETVEQVRAAMQEIGYKPPRVKRGPKGGPRRVVPSCFRTGQFAILTLGGFQGWLGLPVMASVVTGITRAAKELDLRPVLDEMPDPESITPILRRREVDGAIVFVMSGLPLDKLIHLHRHLPVVWAMGGEGGPPQVDHVSADNLGIGHLACEYLIGQRCRQLAYITNEPDWLIMRLRGHAFAGAACDASLPATSYIVNGSPNSLEAYGRNANISATLEAAVDRLAAARPRPDGLFIPTDLLTTRVYPLLVQHGIQPQRDIHIVSCDNEDERLSMLSPRPPSIDIRGEEIGRWAVRQLVQRLQRPDDPCTRVQVAPRIVLPPAEP